MKKDECQELKNIKYKTMLLTNNPVESETQETITCIDDFLEKEKQLNTKLPWSKLEKSIKLKKLYIFADYYVKANNMSSIDNKQLKTVLKDALEKKLLLKSSIVIYDKNKEIISNITNLSYNNVSKKFLVKDVNKRIVTSKSLAPKKPKKTRKVEKEDLKKDKK